MQKLEGKKSSSCLHFINEVKVWIYVVHIENIFPEYQDIIISSLKCGYINLWNSSEKRLDEAIFYIQISCAAIPRERLYLNQLQD